MSESLFSPSWYRVADLKPRLRRHIRIHRHHYHDELWYVLQDPSSQNSHRLNPESYFLISLMNGERSIQEVWDAALERFGDDVPAQQEVINLFSYLHAADVLQCDVVPEALELQQRFEKKSRQEFLQRFLNPMALRIPLLDPERILSWSLPIARYLFSTAGAVIWLVVVMMALVLASSHWGELTGNVADRVLTPQNLLLLWVTFPVVKALHEFGHGLAVKHWGGEVHEMGVMLLVLMPVPYVDASAAWGFREKRKRVVVGAAGMLVEVFIAALALFLWIALEPGTARAITFNVMLIAGVSTILFNANPLLRFDGYYIFSDLLEIPNLAARSNKYIGYLLQRYFLRVKSADPITDQPFERGWFVFYSIASFAYRLMIAAVIITFIAGRFFTVGIILAVWVAVMMLLLPLSKVIRFVLFSPVLRKQRGRSVILSTALGTAVLALFLVVPVPFFTSTEGVIWIPEQSHVRAGASGFIKEITSTPGEEVQTGDTLLVCSDQELVTRQRVLESRQEELEARYRAQRIEDVVAAEVTGEELAAVRNELVRVRELNERLVLHSPVNGVFVLPQADDLVGRFVRQGQLVGYVIESGVPKVRAVVTQQDIDLVRHRTLGVDVRLSSQLDREYPASLYREVPAASDELPSAALGREGGGVIANDPRGAEPNIAYETVFQFELNLPDELRIDRYGGRVFVRFYHGLAPLSAQWYRQLKQLFLRLLDG